MIVKLKAPNQFFIQVDIEFAVAYGFNEATLAGKMMRLEESLRGKFDENGIKWIRMTLEDWMREFPFWSDSTIKRTIKSMNEKTIILTRTFRGRAKWYRLNPAFDGRIVSGQNDHIQAPYVVKMTTSSGQIDLLPRVLPREKTITTTEPDELEKFTQLFTANFGDLSRNEALAANVKEILRQYGIEAVTEAINTALIDRANGTPKTWGYVKGILTRQTNQQTETGSQKNGKPKKHKESTQGRQISEKLNRLRAQTTGGMGV